MSSKEFMESFLEFEHRNKMFEVKMNNVCVWHYVRFNIYHELLKICGGADVMSKTALKENQGKDTWKDIFRKYIACNQFLAHEREVLIIPHERKYRDGSQYYKCIYTHLLDENLVNSHYILDGKSTENKYEVQKSKNVLYCDLESFKKVKKIKIPFKQISKREVNSKIIEPIEKHFRISVDWEYKRKWYNVINACSNGKEYWIRYYNCMLQRIKPKLILVVVSYAYNRMILCEVAKKKNIPVVELQHGAISDLHIAYNFYEKICLPGFPDYVFTYGQFEKENVRFPVNKNRIIPVGFPELEKYCNLRRNRKKGKKVVLFISQALKEIAQYANIVASKLDTEKYRLVFKLHPKEYSNWRLAIGQYLNHSNIEVVGGFEKTIYDFLAQADWVIGNYSTVLYEAQMFDVKVAVLKFGLYENVENLYKYGYALLVDSPEQLITEIEEDTYQPNREVSMFEINSLEKMQANINKIIRSNQKII